MSGIKASPTNAGKALRGFFAALFKRAPCNREDIVVELKGGTGAQRNETLYAVHIPCVRVGTAAGFAYLTATGSRTAFVYRAVRPVRVDRVVAHPPRFMAAAWLGPCALPNQLLPLNMEPGAKLTVSIGPELFQCGPSR